MVYLHWKSAFWVRSCLKTSLWRHTLTDFHDFGINGKKRPYPIPWYQTIILWARQVQVHKGVVTTPLGKPCYKKRLGRTRVNSNNKQHFVYILYITGHHLTSLSVFMWGGVIPSPCWLVCLGGFRSYFLLFICYLNSTLITSVKGENDLGNDGGAKGERDNKATLLFVSRS